MGWYYEGKIIDNIEDFLTQTVDDLYEEKWVEEGLDEWYEPIKLCGAKFYVSDIVKKCDPILFKEIEREEKDHELAEFFFYIECYDPDDEETLEDFLKGTPYETVFSQVIWKGDGENE